MAYVNKYQDKKGVSALLGASILEVVFNTYRELVVVS